MKNIVNWIFGAIILVILASTYMLVMDFIQDGNLVSAIIGIVGLILLVVAMVLGLQEPERKRST